MKKLIEPAVFGPWAVVTGASSGIGEGFARQLAQCGFNLVLVARRKKELEKLGNAMALTYGIDYRTIEADLSLDQSVKEVIQQTGDLEVGLLISNAGTGAVAGFFERTEEELTRLIQLNATSHVQLTHYFGRKMAARKRGGILLTGAMGAVNGVPYMANESGTKGYVEGLGKSLHSELRKFGIHITVLVTTPTDTPVFYKLGFTMKNTPVKPISVQQCVKESLAALAKNKITVLPGFKFRLMNAIMPSSVAREIAGKIMQKNNHLQ